VIIYANFKDQRLYKIPADGSGEPICLTPEGTAKLVDASLLSAGCCLLSKQNVHFLTPRSLCYMLLLFPLPLLCVPFRQAQHSPPTRFTASPMEW